MIGMSSREPRLAGKLRADIVSALLFLNLKKKLKDSKKQRKRLRNGYTFKNC